MRKEYLEKLQRHLDESGESKHALALRAKVDPKLLYRLTEDLDCGTEKWSQIEEAIDEYACTKFAKPPSSEAHP